MELTEYDIRDLEKNLSVNPFGQNRVADVAYAKGERLALATFLVTNVIPDHEHIRGSLRDAAQALLADALALREGVRSSGTDPVGEVIARTRLVLSLLDACYASGYISRANLEVLKSAYIDFAHFLRTSEDGADTERVELDEDYFTPRSHRAKTRSKGQNSIGQKDALKDTSLSDTVSDTNTLSDRQAEKSTRSRSVSTKRKKNARRMAVLDAVSKHGPVYVSDIAKEVTQWSPKTIQRELAALMADGVITKEGDKRWTKYKVS